jgi:hypothetical protein
VIKFDIFEKRLPTGESRGGSCLGIRRLAIFLDEGIKIALLTAGDGCDSGGVAEAAVIITA